MNCSTNYQVVSPEGARKIHCAYTLAREAIGPDIGIDVHCHCELDVPSAIKVAQAVEHIEPLFFEDPLAPEWLRPPRRSAAW